MMLGGYGFKKSAAGAAGYAGRNAFVFVAGGTNQNKLVRCDKDFGQIQELGDQAIYFFTSGPKLSPDRNLVAVGASVTQKFRVYDISGASWVTKANVANPPESDFNVYALAFNPSGTRLAVATHTCVTTSISIYNTTTWARVATIPQSQNQFCYDICYNTDGTKLIVAGYDYVNVWTVSGDNYTKMNGTSLPSGASNVVAVCPVSPTHVACVGSSRVWLLNLTTLANTVANYSNAVGGHNALHTSLDKSVLFQTNTDYGLTAYTIGAGPSLTRINTNAVAFAASGFAVSPDGTKALGVTNGSMEVANLQSMPPYRSGYATSLSSYFCVSTNNYGGGDVCHSGLY